MPPLITCTPPTIASPPVPVKNDRSAGPALTPGNHTMPDAPVALIDHGIGSLPAKNGPAAGDGVEVAVTPETPTPARVIVAMIEPVFTGTVTPLTVTI